MTNLTEQWKKGKLEEYKRYYCKTVWFEDIFIARCHNKGQNDEWWTLENEKYSYNNVHHIKDIEVLSEVPSFEQWSQTYKTKFELLEENTKLKEQLKECELWFTGIVDNMNDKNVGEHNRNLPIGNFEHIFKVFSQKINQVLGEE